MLKDPTWQSWREENPRAVQRMKEVVKVAHKWVDLVLRGQRYEERTRQRNRAMGREPPIGAYLTLAGEMAAALDAAGIEILRLKALVKEEVKDESESPEPRQEEAARPDEAEGSKADG